MRDVCVVGLGYIGLPTAMLIANSGFKVYGMDPVERVVETVNRGEIHIVEEDGKLVWECPHCGNRDQTKMNVARRTCGYIGTQFWNQGRTQEIKDRVLHL